MIYDVRQSTVYRYESPVAYAHHVLRLTPIDRDGQRVHAVALDVTPARIGQTTRVITDDAYGRGPVTRTVTTLRGVVRHGNSGGPAIDADGRVRTTVFAQRVGSTGGYGVPDSSVRDALAAPKRPLEPGPCVR